MVSGNLNLPLASPMGDSLPNLPAWEFASMENEDSRKKFSHNLDLLKTGYQSPGEGLVCSCS